MSLGSLAPSLAVLFAQETAAPLPPDRWLAMAKHPVGLGRGAGGVGHVADVAARWKKRTLDRRLVWCYCLGLFRHADAQE